MEEEETGEPYHSKRFLINCMRIGKCDGSRQSSDHLQLDHCSSATSIDYRIRDSLMDGGLSRNCSFGELAASGIFGESTREFCRNLQRWVVVYLVSDTRFEKGKGHASICILIFLASNALSNY